MKTFISFFCILLIFNAKAQILPDPIPYRKGDKWGYSDKSKKIIIPIQFEEACPFEEGLAKVKMNGNWGFIDKNGREFVKCQYSEIQSFKNGYSIVGKHGKWGVVERNGREVVPCQFDEVTHICEKYFRAKKGNSFVICTEGRELLSTACEEVTSLKDEVLRFKAEGKWGFISKTRGEIIHPKYEELSEFVNGLAKVLKNGKIGYVDINGVEFFED
ncbi:MAG: hypothetical protein OHK0038_14530 [Flammeovirgaceae bacterium]